MKMLKGRFMVIWLLLVFSALFFVLDNAAEARRLGGGRSFGSKPSYQRSAPAPAQRDFDKGQAQRTLPQTTSSSRWGGLGGVFGGLLMGGLIGSLLFGGGGPMGGPGILDLLVIGGILFFVVKLFRARRNPAPQQAGHTPYGSPGSNSFEAYNEHKIPGVNQAEEVHLKPVLPADFDAAEFLKGAKAAYNRLQESWSRRDLDDIAHFASPAVMTELRKQATVEPDPSPVEILLVEATILDVKDSGDERAASVFFDVLMREEPGKEDQPQVKEIWHFKRSLSDSSSFWMLDGIQQVE